MSFSQRRLEGLCFVLFFFSLFPPFHNELDFFARDTVTLYFESCQLTTTLVSNINTMRWTLPRVFLELGPRSHWGNRVGEDLRWCEILHQLTWRAAIRMDDFVTTEILGCMDNQIISPTALRCALRSPERPERRELRLQISELCVLSATFAPWSAYGSN